jgi:hypothetical protein
LRWLNGKMANMMANKRFPMHFPMKWRGQCISCEMKKHWLIGMAKQKDGQWASEWVLPYPILHYINIQTHSLMRHEEALISWKKSKISFNLFPMTKFTLNSTIVVPLVKNLWNDAHCIADGFQQYQKHMASLFKRIKVWSQTNTSKQTHINIDLLGIFKKYRSIDLTGCWQNKLILNMWLVVIMV